MYARQPPEGRFPRTVRIPRNYSGNAFRAEEEVIAEAADADLPPTGAVNSEPEDTVVRTEGKGDAAAAVGKLFPSPGFRLDLGHLLRRESGGIGMEELLIIGLILLLSQSETKDDLILLLLLLLFIK